MAKIELGKEYKTRDGRNARVLCIDRANTALPVVALVADKYGSESIVGTFSSTGDYVPNHPHSCDLIEVPKIKFPQFKRGDAVVVWDNDRNKAVRVFSHSSEHSAYTYSANGGVTAWNFCEPFILPEVDDESV